MAGSRLAVAADLLLKEDLVYELSVRNIPLPAADFTVYSLLALYRENESAPIIPENVKAYYPDDDLSALELKVEQNAEMSFNFGAQPFKHSPESGYIAVCEAPKDNVKQNEIGTGGGSSQSKPVKNAPQAIIIEPSRELAEQTYNQIVKFKKHIDNPEVRELLVIGGVNVKDQIGALNAGLKQNYDNRESAIKKCITVSAESVRSLKEKKEKNFDDPRVLKALKTEQTKLRLLQAELNVEEIIKERTTKVYYERCRSFYKPPDFSV